MKDKKALGTQRPPQTPNPANQGRDSLPWRSLEQQVVRMQKQVSQASQRGDKQAVHDLQQRLMESEAARLLAVRRVAEENQGKDTAGVDGIKSLSPKERLAMASTIHPKYWNYQPPMPVRRVWVPKPGTAERRPLAILPMIDRCKQALVKLALEPEWEVRFEPHSYGFRPGRSAHDALAAIVVAMKRRPMFVFHADIAEAFDHVLLRRIVIVAGRNRVAVHFQRGQVLEHVLDLLDIRFLVNGRVGGDLITANLRHLDGFHAFLENSFTFHDQIFVVKFDAGLFKKIFQCTGLGDFEDPGDTSLFRPGPDHLSRGAGAQQQAQ